MTVNHILEQWVWIWKMVSAV